MEGIIIKDIVCRGRRLDIDFTVSEGLEQYFRPEHHFFAEYSCDISDVPPSVLVVPLLANLMPLAWLVDCVVWVHEIDRDFYRALPEIKRGFQEMYPDFQFRGSLIPAYVVDNRYEPEKEAITLFTGGIDATTTFLRHLDESPILFNTNGWYTDDIREDAVYNADRNAIEAVAADFGVGSCFSRSNFATFIRAGAMTQYIRRKKIPNSWWFGFQHSLAFLGCAVVAGYHHRVSRLYIGSSNSPGEYTLLVSDPRIDGAFCTAAMTTCHDSYDLSRQGKVRFLLDKQRELDRPLLLRVCSFHEKNCAACEKCLRTMLGIAAEGGDPKSFGFELQDTLLNTLKVFLRHSVLEVDRNHMPEWNEITERLGENYALLKEPEVYDFLKSYDFKKERIAWRLRYYRGNFFKIIKRRLTSGKSR